MAALSRRGRNAVDIWPGFVDALATLLMVIIFLLMIFVVAQFYLSEALSGRDEALDRLNRQVAELANQLALEQEANADLQSSVAQLSAELQSTLAERDRFAGELGSLRGLRDRLTSQVAELQDRIDSSDAERSRLAAALQASEALLAERSGQLTSTQATLEERLKALEEATQKLRLTEEALARSEQAYADSAAELARRMKELEEANKTVTTERETVELQLRELAELRQDIIAMQAYREELEQQLQQMMRKTKTGEEELLREREISAAAKAQLALLNRQLSQLRAQIAALNEALEASEARDKEQRAQIADLGSRLNAALASKVQELSRYRSEFFGRLRDVLGDRQDIRIVGDRFVFQSEVLFASGEAELGQAGKEQLGALARTLIDIAGRIPKDIDWILQVDGHTDRNPIRTEQFPSNWELSTARAISVVRFLQLQGIPARNLAATGYAEYQPLDPTNTPDAYARNRRIELKLTQR